MPTSSQNTNTIAMLPAMHEAQHAEAEQRQVLEEAVEAAGAVQVMAVGERDFVVGARRAARRACSRWRRSGCSEAISVTMQNIDDGQRVDVVADREPQRAELRRACTSRR